MICRTVLAAQTNPSSAMFRAVVRQYAIFFYLSLCLPQSDWTAELEFMIEWPAWLLEKYTSRTSKLDTAAKGGQLQSFPCHLVTPPMCWMVLMERNGKSSLNPHQ